MFLQRYRKSNQKEFLSPPQDLSSLKLSELLKKMSPNEIRRHQKKNVYLNPRTYLIQNTKKVIRPQQKEVKENINTHSQTQQLKASSKNKEVFQRTHVDLSSREARREAAKQFRQRIWKSSDITPLLRAQEQRSLRRKRGFYKSFNQLDGGQKIHRYQDSFLLQQQADPAKREALRRQWLQGAMKNNLSLRSNSSQKNPQRLQITNIEFKEQLQQSTGSNHSRQLLNRQRRKQLRMLQYSSLLRQQKRPSTTGAYHRDRIDDNIIQPW